MSVVSSVLYGCKSDNEVFDFFNPTAKQMPNTFAVIGTPVVQVWCQVPVHWFIQAT